MGKMAQQKAQSQEVKQFGQQMAQDHDAANSELMAVASGKGADMPKGLDKDHTKLRDKLAKLNGADFDREYMRQMVKDHQKDVKDFEKEAKSGQDSDIKNFAQSTLPKLQQHLQMAQDIDKRIRAEAPMTSQRSTAPGGTAGSSAPPATRR